MPDLTAKCSVSGKDFLISEWEQDFLGNLDIPLPQICPEERHRRRLSHRNERSIYKGKCHLSGKDIVTMYSPDKPYKSVAQDIWWGDDWDALEYGRDFDFSRPFFEQFAELQKDVPHLSLMNVRAENSDYCNVTNSNRNCYLVFGGDYNEDSLYSCFSMHCKDVSDVYWVHKSQLIYDCIDCVNCYNLKYSQNSYNCRDSSFLFECRNLSNCFGCVGLRNKEYHIFNQPYSPEKYVKKLEAYKLDTWSGVQHMKKEFAKFKLQFPHKAAYIVNSENCSGNNITNAQNCENCFDVEGPAQDCKDLFLAGFDGKDMLSCDHVGFKSQIMYENLGCIEDYNCAFNSFVWTCQNVFYSDMLISSKDCFGCSNMKRKQYCIFNKQYSEQEYEDLKARIIEHMKKTGEWGNFFPIKNSMFGYNETVADDYFPLAEEEVEAKGFKWHNKETREIGSGDKIPDCINDVTKEIFKANLVCEESGKPYRIIPQELKLYKQMNVPIPHFAPETRNKMRIKMRNPIYSFDRNCMKCGKEVKSPYSADRPEKIYCESCYLSTVY